MILNLIAQKFQDSTLLKPSLSKLFQILIILVHFNNVQQYLNRFITISIGMEKSKIMCDNCNNVIIEYYDDGYRAIEVNVSFVTLIFRWSD